MKYASLILALALGSSCTVVRTRNAAGGEATYASLGGDSKNVAIGPDGAHMDDNNNSNGFGKAAGTATAITGVFATAGALK